MPTGSDRTLTVVRDIDGTTIEYEVAVPPRSLIATMRLEHLKPGRIVSLNLAPDEE